MAIDKLKQMWQAATDSDFQTIAGLAHQLKGVGGSFGMPEVTRVAGELEQQARQGCDSTVVALLYELDSLCQPRRR